LIDEVGEPTATRLRREWARQWWQETGTCPYCGKPGPLHTPDEELTGKERTMSNTDIPPKGAPPVITLTYGDRHSVIRFPPQEAHLAWQEIHTRLNELINSTVALYREDSQIAARVAKGTPVTEGLSWRRQVHAGEIDIALRHLHALGALDDGGAR
jgi:hypothetical protein